MRNGGEQEDGKNGFHRRSNLKNNVPAIKPITEVPDHAKRRA
jgi:hypothetical protein